MAVQTFSFAAFVISALILALVVAGVVTLIVAASQKRVATAAVVGTVLLGFIGVGLLVGWTTTRRAVVIQGEAVRVEALEAEARSLHEMIEQQGSRIGTPSFDDSPAETGDGIHAESSAFDVPSTASANSTPLPDWAQRRTVREGEKTLVVVSSQQFATREQARQDAVEQARSLVQWDFDADKGQAPALDVPDNDFVSSGSSGPGYRVHIGFGENDSISYVGGEWMLLARDTVDLAVKKEAVQEIQRSAGENEFTVYRTHLLVELSPEVRRQIEPIWRDQVSHGRSLKIGALLAGLTMCIGVFAGYFRLDDVTNGRHRWPLRLGAVAALGGIALASCMFGARIVAAERGALRQEAVPDTPSVPIEVSEPMVSLPGSTSTTSCQSF